MKTIIHRIEHFLVSNTVWIFLTALLVIDYMFVIEAPRSTWGNYISNLFWFCLFFSPILLFTGFRTWLQQRLNQILFIFLWIYCFILHSLLLSAWMKFYVEKDILFSGVNIRESVIHGVVLIVGGILLLTEIAIQFNNNLLQWVNKIKWIQKFGLERSLISVILLLSAFTGIIGVMELVDTNKAISFALIIWYLFKFLFFTIQFILIGLVYYFFYYVNHYILIPKLLKQRGIIYYGFSVAALILIFYPIFITLIHWLPVVKELNIRIFIANGNLFGGDGGGVPFLLMVLSVPIIVSNQWFKQSGEIAALAKEKSETELNLLKQQINPHFFFNTLNNLYALSLKNDVTTPEVIMRLSELMRYVIYRGKEDTVSLAEEIKHIEDYICLQQLRLHKHLELTFTKNIEDEKLHIPPLLFIILVENAFKHGIEPSEKQSFLHIYIENKEREILFTCKNSIEEKNNKAPGIGLHNLQRRLALRFPNRHEIKVQETANTFTATLKLAL
ncbi:MAG: histidine kinase [Saprospiraceae bacterium]|nr:histidine kinase [Saprospiraceae bacterium]